MPYAKEGDAAMVCGGCTSGQRDLDGLCSCDEKNGRGGAWLPRFGQQKKAQKGCGSGTVLVRLQADSAGWSSHLQPARTLVWRNYIYKGKPQQRKNKQLHVWLWSEIRFSLLPPSVMQSPPRHCGRWSKLHLQSAWVGITCGWSVEPEHLCQGRATRNTSLPYVTTCLEASQMLRFANAMGRLARMDLQGCTGAQLSVYQEKTKASRWLVGLMQQYRYPELSILMDHTTVWLQWSDHCVQRQW